MKTVINKDAITYWWLILLAGFTLLGLGIWVLAQPFESYLTLSVAFAFTISATGLCEVVFSIANRKQWRAWVWALLGGVVDFCVGSYLFFYPLITMAILPLIIGFWVLFRGIFAIGHSLDMRYSGLWEWGWLFLSGMFIIFLALMILDDPTAGILNIILWTGLAFISAGIFRIYLSLKLRKRKKDDVDKSSWRPIRKFLNINRIQHHH